MHSDLVPAQGLFELDRVTFRGSKRRSRECLALSDIYPIRKELRSFPIGLEMSLESTGLHENFGSQLIP